MQVHPAQISPAEAFDIFYFIRNHTDATTYYVRALVYDVRTGELLTTVSLSPSATNARLFITTLQAPADPVGIGRNIVAIATVYTDSSFSTKSPDYEEQEQYFLIRAVSPLAIGGGGVDMRQMRELVEDALDARLEKLPKPEKLPEMPFEAVFGAIGAVQREVNRIPKEHFDPAPIIEEIRMVGEKVDAIPVPDVVDLSPVFSRLDRVAATLDGLPKILSDAGRTLVAAQAHSLKQAADTIIIHAKSGIEEMMGKQELIVPLSSLFKPEVEPKKEKSPDLNHLM